MSSRRGDHSDAVARAAGWASPSLQRARNVVVATGDPAAPGHVGTRTHPVDGGAECYIRATTNGLLRSWAGTSGH